MELPQLLYLAKSRFSFHRLEQKPSVKVSGLECVCVFGGRCQGAKGKDLLSPEMLKMVMRW